MSEKTWTIKWQYIEIDGRIINGERDVTVRDQQPLTDEFLPSTFDEVSNSLIDLLTTGEIHAFNSIRVLPNVEA